MSAPCPTARYSLSSLRIGNLACQLSHGRAAAALATGVCQKASSHVCRNHEASRRTPSLSKAEALAWYMSKNEDLIPCGLKDGYVPDLQPKKA